MAERKLFKLSILGLLVVLIPSYSRSNGIDDRQDRLYEPLEGQAFIDKACGGAIAGIELAQFALNRSANEQVLELTRKLIQESTLMIKRLKKASNCGNLALKEATDPTQKYRPPDHLEDLAGAAFDLEYLNKVIEDHRARIDDFESEAFDKVARQLPRDAAGRPTVRNSPRNMIRDTDMAGRIGESVFAREMLPTLQQNLAEAERIREELQGE